MVNGNKLQGNSSRWLLVGLLLIFGVFIRLLRIDKQLILDDEWHALNAVQNHDYWWIFSHFGHADHSIPLALLFEGFSHTIGLGEFTMRLPSLLAGILTMMVLPVLMRPWLKRNELQLMVGLIAISPFLINYSRIARPYALLALLAGASLPLAWRWWHNKSRGSGIAWFACTVLAAWLNPVSLAVTMGPFLWFAGDSLQGWRQNHDLQMLYRLVLMGVAISMTVALLMYMPLSNDFASLAVKSGLHSVEPATFLVALSLFSGSGHLPVVLGMTITFVIGSFGLYRRDPSFSLYLLIIACAAMLAVVLTGAEWINHGIVLARYLIGLMPLFLALAAIGIVQTGNYLVKFAQLPAPAIQVFVPLALLVLVFGGPLPGTDPLNSQFVHHMSNQFDYDLERNPIVAALNPVIPESFYADIATANPAGDAIVVEAPWHLESNWNPLPLYQAVHGQRVMVGFVGGICAEGLYGELRQDVNGLEFANFTTLQNVLEGRVNADYLVLRSQGLPGSRSIKVEIRKCEQLVRAKFGAPWRVTDTAQVFMVSGGFK